MDTIKSPRFILACFGMVSVTVLGAFKILSPDLCVGLLVGILGGIGVTASKGNAIASAGAALPMLGGLGAAFALSGCAGPGVELSLYGCAVLISGVVILVGVGWLATEIKGRQLSKSEAVTQRLKRVAGRAAWAPAALLCVVLMVMAWSTSGCGSLTAKNVAAFVDTTCKVISVGSRAIGEANDWARDVCSLLPEPQKAGCFAQQQKYGDTAAEILKRAETRAKACGL
jgi:hypothetical protein